MSSPAPSWFEHYWARAALQARASGAAEVSFRGPQQSQVLALTNEGLLLPDGQQLPWAVIEQVADNDSVCFEVVDGEAVPLRVYSEEFQRTYQLYPTEAGPPALLLSGFVMHRIRDVDPFEGAARMARALGKVRGRVLDTTTGLGYAAIVAARTAQQVVTIELDASVRQLAAKNPWSRELFESSNIELRVGDSSLLIQEIPDSSFEAVLHDPPAINVAGELYSAAFYEQVRRVLSRSGRFFHYIGDPASASGGRTTKGVVERLRAAGFTRVTPRPEAFGVLASP
ncbi:MAG TPA: hypothetical protein VLC09_08135 [Polyangiaceae bacterium]|nr:hypothetical protein [Polyangiaceae bacterium]